MTNISITLALALGVLSLCPVTALAQAWPSKPIRLIVPFPPGGGVDFMGRIISQKLSERLGQQVAVDNRAGANRIVGLEILKLKDITDRMLSEGAVPTPSSPEEFTAYMKSDLKKWGDVVKLANIKAE